MDVCGDFEPATAPMTSFCEIAPAPATYDWQTATMPTSEPVSMSDTGSGSMPSGTRTPPLCIGDEDLDYQWLFEETSEDLEQLDAMCRGWDHLQWSDLDEYRND